MAKMKPPERNGAFHFVGANLPTATVARLLEHPDRNIRTAAAFGEWFREPEGTVREDLRENWRTAIVEVEADEELLEAMFAKNHGLAFDWTKARMSAAEQWRLWDHRSGIAAAAKVLTKEQ